jgi:hypothetical protein
VSGLELALSRNPRTGFSRRPPTIAEFVMGIFFNDSFFFPEDNQGAEAGMARGTSASVQTSSKHLNRRKRW